MSAQIFTLYGESLTTLCLNGFSGSDDPEMCGQLILDALALRSIKKINKITHLYINNNPSWWKDETCPVRLVTFIGQQRSLKTVNLRMNQFTSDLTEQLLGSLVRLCHQLKNLDLNLSANFDSDQACSHLAELIAKSASI